MINDTHNSGGIKGGIIKEGKAALVTGASGGIGSEVCRVLLDMGYRVYGIGRDFSKVYFPDAPEGQWNPLVLDLLQTGRVEEAVSSLLCKEKISVLVNAAGVGYYGQHQDISPARIREMIRVNLETPLILSGMLLRCIRETRGFIINISSVTADQINPHGCAYGASKAGLSSFGRSLFAENRKYGVKVVEICPDMTRTGLYRNADFEADPDELASLDPREVGQALRYILSRPQGTVVSQIRLQPQYNRIRRKKTEKKQ